MGDRLALWPSGEAAGLEPAHGGPSPSSAALSARRWCLDGEHVCELEVTPTAPGCGRRFALGRGRTPEAAEKQAREIASWPEVAT